MNDVNWMFVLFYFSTFSLQTSQSRLHRSDEWSGVVETVLQWRGKEGVEVGSIHIRFELSPHFTQFQGKQLLLTLMLDIPKYKKLVFCCHKTHGSHTCQILVYKVICQCMFFILHCISKEQHVPTKWSKQSVSPLLRLNGHLGFGSIYFFRPSYLADIGYIFKYLCIKNCSMYDIV